MKKTTADTYGFEGTVLKLTPSEHNEQASFIDTVMFEYLPHYPEIHPLLFSIPNGSVLAGDRKRRAAQMNKLKREGFTPGVADVLFLSARGGYMGLALEFKRVDRENEKDGGLEESQQEFLTAARAEGYLAEVVYGADHALQVFRNYLKLPRTQDLIWKALKEAENKQDVGEVINVLKEVVLKW